jgi:hypothetical protein
VARAVYLVRVPTLPTLHGEFAVGLLLDEGEKSHDTLGPIIIFTNADAGECRQKGDQVGKALNLPVIDAIEPCTRVANAG